MPLRAVCNTKNLHAFDFDATEWGNLKQEYRSLGLLMPCCGSSAIPKTSSLGTHFFAHSRIGNCTSAPETPEHLYCKQLIAKAAKDAGWTAVTEEAGISANGESWVADVLCQKGSAKIAFEVQISPQAHEETVRRQVRYKESGIRAAWFYGPKQHRERVATDRSIPIFCLSKIEAGKEPDVQKYGVTLSQFVIAMLTKRLVWTRSSHTQPFYVASLQDTCGRCKRPTRLIYGHSESNNDALSKALSETVTADSISSALSRLLNIITNEELQCLGYAPIVTVHTHRQIRYENRYCQRCETLLGNDSLANKVNEARHSPKPMAINDDGEFVEHPLRVELIDRNNDDCGYWTLRI